MGSVKKMSTKNWLRLAAWIVAMSAAPARAQEATPAVDDSLGAPGESCRDASDCRSALECRANVCAEGRSELDSFLAEFAAATGRLPEGMSDAPSKGTGLMVTGIVLTSAGGVAALVGGLLVGLTADSDPGAGSFVLLGVGGAVALGGIPMLITGIVQRGNYKDWQEEQLQQLNAGGELLIAPLPSGVGIGWGASF